MPQNINAAIAKGARLEIIGNTPKLKFNNKESFAAYFTPLVQIVDCLSYLPEGGYRYALTVGVTKSYFNFNNDTFYIDSPRLAEIARGEGFRVVRI